MFNNIQNNDFANIVKGRRSVRKYDENVKISKEEMSEMIAEASLAPSSANMQPWRVVVVDTPEGKEKLRPLVRFNTLQNDTSSAMVLIFGDTQSYFYAEEIYNTAVEQGKMPAEAFGLDEERYVPVMIISIGKAKEEGHESVRLGSDKITFGK
ncbi:MAG: nitroreductase family protein [Paenibacillus macerans]|uniref:Nitroreductase n=1 Tax=Paenibacillus macerans TaxID=44252 RepID=A0A090ZXS8_PAEMA|nr:nitroreductase family protein [Paenibacillus macerans]KFN08931.1 nitroreductase [Paenibacillus macerans]MCY7561053.1 nitroreductase family protein [Paenibacillus macerans]MDU7473799.1 nitroreductase family protein [Paenibacillus macerans]MEC0149233.1 nitroreductase family protein [Paenibacillus macerans]SUA83281.1 nitroreductase [Paenibacillus macerans]